MSTMLPQDLAGMMGGAAPQPAAGGSLPPDVAALVGGDPSGGAAPAPSVAEGQYGGGQDALIAAIDALQEAIDAEADQEDIQVLLQCQTKMQAILAKNQKEADASMGGNLSPSAARKMAGGLGA